MTSNSKKKLQDKISKLEKEIWDKEKEVVLLKRELSKQNVSNYEFQTAEGTVTLSDLFNEKSDLILIHNMGKKCPYCTMWADGFNGLLHYITNRSAFVIVSPDNPVIQRVFAESRGWKFEMVSDKNGSFTTDMGYKFDDKKYMPGVSVFYKDETGKITRTCMDVFGPGDNYNSPWHLFRLLKDGINEWSPKFKY